jgi:hypothetical protein
MTPSHETTRPTKALTLDRLTCITLDAQTEVRALYKGADQDGWAEETVCELPSGRVVAIPTNSLEPLLL